VFNPVRFGRKDGLRDIIELAKPDKKAVGHG